MIDYSKYKLGIKKKSKLGSKEDVAKMAAPKLVQILYNILHIGPRLILRSVYMVMRANIVTRILSALVLVIFDTISLIRKRISFKQFCINVTLALMLLIGGTTGWYAGESIAGILFENVVIGIIVSIIFAGLFGFALGAITEKIFKRFVKDDAAHMLEICNDVFCELAQKYSLTPEQAETACTTITIDASTIRNMYATKDKASYAKTLIEPRLSVIGNSSKKQEE